MLDEHEGGLALPLIVQLHVSFSGIKFFFPSFFRTRERVISIASNKKIILKNVWYDASVHQLGTYIRSANGMT